MSKHIVIKVLASGMLAPSPVPVEHTNYDSAIKECERLANANPGTKFIVFSESASHQCEADIPTSSLYKQSTPPGFYMFVRFGDGTNCENTRVMPFAAWVGPADACTESNPVVFLDRNSLPMAKPMTRNIRWKRKA